MKNIITIIYVYRNLDLVRVERSLNSLKNQTNQKFKIVFVDYGSDSSYSKQLLILLKKYSNIKYVYAETSFLPWNRSHAINIGVLQGKSDYIFTSDVDMIYRKDFIEILHKIKRENYVFSLRVAYLSKHNKHWHNFKKFKIEKISEPNANGMSLFFKKNIIDNGMFDEKYVYWGGEDNDIMDRLKSKGVTYEMYDDSIIAFHQFHPEFKNNLNNFPIAINRYLYGNSKQIFQKFRKRGEILNYDFSQFHTISIAAHRYLSSQLLNTYLFNTKITKFKIELILEKNDDKYNSGKLYFLKKTFNMVLNKFGLQVNWFGYKDQFLYRNELKTYFFNFLLSNYDRLDLVGIKENKNGIMFYLKKTI